MTLDAPTPPKVELCIDFEQCQQGGAPPKRRADCITTYDGFDSFPFFSSDGRWLLFSSNRGGSVEGETNLFIAQWRDQARPR